MTATRHYLLLLIICSGFGWVRPACAQRDERSFDTDWHFHLGHPHLDLPSSSTTRVLARWTFERGTEGWQGESSSIYPAAAQGILRVQYQEKGTQLLSPPIKVRGPIDVVLRLRNQTSGNLSVLWATSQQNFTQTQMSFMPIKGGSVWQEVRFTIGSTEILTQLRLDPPGQQGLLELDTLDLETMLNPGLLGPNISTPNFNDTTWQVIQIPHDWAITGPFDPDGDGHTGKLPWRGHGWYRKVFKLEQADTAKRIYLDFDGVMAQPHVYINGRFAGGWDYGYNSFRIDATPFVHPGPDNVMAVHVDTRQRHSRWYPGAGIYRKVRLVVLDPVHVAHWGVFVTTPEISTTEAEVRVAAEVENHSNQQQLVTVSAVIHDPNGHPVAQARMSGPIDAGTTCSFIQTLTVPHPQYWDVTHPHLYTAVTGIVHQGVISDHVTTPFGIRTFAFHPQDGFQLNGRRVPLKGVNLHHDHGPLGAAFYTRAMERQLELLQTMGCNAIRTSHNIPAPELLELCDRMGFLVFNEVFDKWHHTADRVQGEPLLAFGHKQIRNFCRRDRNHPSIIVWSIGNEIPYVLQNQSGQAPAEVKAMAEFFRLYDPTRPVTLANHMLVGLKGGILDALDIQSWNYGRKYVNAKAVFPDQASICTESASALSTRGHYEFPHPQKKDDFSDSCQVSSYDWQAAAWADIPDIDFAGLTRFPYCAGEFVWTGFDYLGEPTPYDNTMVQAERITQRQMARSSYFGILDLCGMPKDRYYLYRSHWAPEKTTLHILPHWNWPEREGKTVPVYVYTNGDSAELFLNGRSLGRRSKRMSLPSEDANYYAVMDTYRLRWEDVSYQPGELKVVATLKDIVIGTTTRKTAGPPVQLRLTPDRTKLQATGKDLAYILVEAIDNQGTLCPRAMDTVSFSIRGAGQLAGIGNGNPLCLESFTAPHHSLFYGKAMLIVRTTEVPGTIEIQAQSGGLTTASLSLITSH